MSSTSAIKKVRLNSGASAPAGGSSGDNGDSSVHSSPALTSIQPQWTSKDANDLYGVTSWGEKYYSINANGNVTVEPTGRGGDAPRLDLHTLVDDCIKRGHQPPLLLRFADIVSDKIRSLNAAFEKCIHESKYDGDYQQVFPLRVCPSRSVLEEVIDGDLVGLSASSKPELLIVLAMLRSRKNVIICTGYKDSEYVETALLAQQLGQIPIIIIEKLSELNLVLSASERLGIKPIIGVRTKIISVPLNNASDTLKIGKNRNLGFSVDVGDKAKFGLSSSEIMMVYQRLKDANLLDSLQMLYFHIGSQISNISSIKKAVKEASQFFVQLHKLDANMRYFNVGGGLAVDYDGSRTSKQMSLNYSVEEYASDVVNIIKDACVKNSVPMPTIISESGRNVTAHHSVVVFNVTDATTVHPLKPNNIDNLFSTSNDVPEPQQTDHELCFKLYEVLRNIEPNNLQESMHDARQYKEEALALFTLGMLELPDRAKAETLFWCCVHDVVEHVKKLKYVPEELEDLKSLLSFTYYCNFSLFQSAPDAWARDFLFPVVPLHRLNEAPTIIATLADLTCDSDGKVACFSSTELRNGQTKELLELHHLKGNQPYYIGMFLTGAYQEILGSMHNLYGDTHILVIESDADSAQGYTIKHSIPGNTIDDVLKSFQYEPHYMLENIRSQSERALRNKDLNLSQYKTLVSHYERSLRNYTYLSTEIEFHNDGLLMLDEDEDGVLCEMDDGSGSSILAPKVKNRQSNMSRYIFSYDDPTKRE